MRRAAAAPVGNRPEAVATPDGVVVGLEARNALALLAARARIGRAVLKSEGHGLEGEVAEHPAAKAEAAGVDRAGQVDRAGLHDDDAADGAVPRRRGHRAAGGDGQR